MKVRCPKCGDKSRMFMATAHITETWLLDETGEFIATMDDGDQQVTHRPDKDDIWACYHCGSECEVSD